MVINSLGPLLLEEADHEVLGWAGKQAEGDYSTTEAIRGTPAGWGHYMGHYMVGPNHHNPATLASPPQQQLGITSHQQQ